MAESEIKYIERGGLSFRFIKRTLRTGCSERGYWYHYIQRFNVTVRVSEEDVMSEIVRGTLAYG